MTMTESKLNKTKKAMKEFGSSLERDPNTFKVRFTKPDEGVYQFIIGTKDNYNARASFFIQDDMLFVTEFGNFSYSWSSTLRKLEYAKACVYFFYQLAEDLELKGITLATHTPSIDSPDYYLPKWGFSGCFSDESKEQTGYAEIIKKHVYPYVYEDGFYFANTEEPINFEMFLVDCLLMKEMNIRSVNAKINTTFDEHINKGMSFSSFHTYSFSHNGYEKGKLTLSKEDGHIKLKERKLKFDEIITKDNAIDVLNKALDAASSYAIQHAEENPPRENYDLALSRAGIGVYKDNGKKDAIYQELRLIVSPIDIDNKIAQEHITVFQEYDVYYVSMFNHIFVVDNRLNVQVFSKTADDVAKEEWKEAARQAFNEYLDEFFTN